MQSNIPSFIGWAVIGFGGGVGVLAILAAMYGALAFGFSIYVQKLFNGVRNFHAVYQWDKAGRPVWKAGEDGVFRMEPTTKPKSFPA